MVWRRGRRDQIGSKNAPEIKNDHTHAKKAFALIDKKKKSFFPHRTMIQSLELGQLAHDQPRETIGAIGEN
jgi:hypothetical protein